MTLLLPESRETPVKSRIILTLLRFQEGLRMKTEGRSRHTVWMEDAVWQRVQEHYKSDACSTQNEFIAKAIMFYCGYLQSEYAGDFLPKILGETLEAISVTFYRLFGGNSRETFCADLKRPRPQMTVEYFSRIIKNSRAGVLKGTSAQ